MKTLIIDDDGLSIRNEILKKMAVAEGASSMDFALSSSEAIQKLTENSYDLVFFDHDLGGNDTSMKVIDFFLEENQMRLTKAVVHTANPAGANKLCLALDRIADKVRKYSILSFGVK